MRSCRSTATTSAPTTLYNDAAMHELLARDDLDIVISRGLPLGLASKAIRFSALDGCTAATSPGDNSTGAFYYFLRSELCRAAEARPGFSGARARDARLTLDEDADLAFFRAVFSELYTPAGIFGVDELVGLLQRQPELVEINAWLTTRTTTAATRTSSARGSAIGHQRHQGDRRRSQGRSLAVRRMNVHGSHRRERRRRRAAVLRDRRGRFEPRRQPRAGIRADRRCGGRKGGRRQVPGLPRDRLYPKARASASTSSSTARSTTSSPSWSCRTSGCHGSSRAAGPGHPLPRVGLRRGVGRPRRPVRAGVQSRVVRDDADSSAAARRVQREAGDRLHRHGDLGEVRASVDAFRRDGQRRSRALAVHGGLPGADRVAEHPRDRHAEGSLRAAGRPLRPLARSGSSRRSRPSRSARTCSRKHFTLDNALPGPDHRFASSRTSSGARRSGARSRGGARSGEKIADPVEEELRRFARRSIFAARDICAGEPFTSENVTILRNGSLVAGLEPVRLDDVLRRRARATSPPRRRYGKTTLSDIALRAADEDDVRAFWAWRNDESGPRSLLQPRAGAVRAARALVPASGSPTHTRSSTSSSAPMRSPSAMSASRLRGARRRSASRSTRRHAGTATARPRSTAAAKPCSVEGSPTGSWPG